MAQNAEQETGFVITQLFHLIIFLRSCELFEDILHLSELLKNLQAVATVANMGDVESTNVVSAGQGNSQDVNNFRVNILSNCS